VGREALCACNWNGSRAEVKALIEPPELILRGGMRRRIPIAAMKQIRADGQRLCFTFNDESVVLELESAVAAKWAMALMTPPPSLAKKLGLTSESVVRMIGEVDDQALEKAITEAKEMTTRSGDVILARVNTPRELMAALKKAASDLSRGVPIWFIYPKGPGHALNEQIVRATVLSVGIVDTKVAAVSPALTALRFVKRKNRSPTV
jgi:hypothetical protein